MALRIAGLALLLLAVLQGPARADVVIISNGSEVPVRFHVRGTSKRAEAYQLSPGALLRLVTSAPLEAIFSSRGAARSRVLEVDTIHVFVPAADAIDLEPLALPAADHLAVAWRGQPGRQKAADEPGIVKIKVFVDDEEAARPELWHERLRRRIEAASKIIDQHCGMRFEIEAYDTWDSDDKINDFNESLAEFMRETQPGSAQLAIGFSSQYKFRAGQVKLGGIPSPFFPYLLIREWPQKQSEVERLEVLVHELGHYLGAVHSPSTLAVMRPMLGDKQANAKDFRVGYDPLNTLALNLVAEEWRGRGVRHLRQLSFRTKARLTCIYLTLAEALPDDPAAMHFTRVMGIPTEKLETLLLEQRRHAAARQQQP